MKIVYVTPNIRNCGPVNILMTLINYVAKENEIFVFSVFGDRDDSDLVEKLVSKNVKVRVLKMTKKDFIFYGVKRLSKELELIKPDIVHSHGLQADVLVSKLKGEFKKISTIHSNIPEDFEYQFGRFKSILLIKYRFRLMKRFDENVCCSESVYDALSGKVNAPMSCIRNGINIEKYKSDEKIRKEIRKQLGIPIDSRIYLTCAPLIKRKRVYELVRLIRPVLGDNEYFLVIGDGPEFVNCKKLENKNIILLGHKNNPTKYYIASDVYVSNSASEGLPMSVLEAIASDNLLLLSDIPAHRECIKSTLECCGAVFSKDNFVDTFKMISNRIEMHRKIVFDKYSISDARMGEKYLRVYKEVING